MKKTVLLWILAFMITISAAVYQRITGPTYPLKVKAHLDGKEISYSLDRTHGGDANHVVSIPTNDEKISGTVLWKRLGTTDPLTVVPMVFADGKLSAELPHQPPAGKLEYSITLSDGNKTEVHGTIIRFKGDVPALILIVHVFCMFTGMLFSTRAGLEVFNPERQFKKLADIAFGLLTVGGMMLGPAVLWFAFGDLWTGFPFGTDITDNKTLIAFIVWLAALIAVRKSKNPERWIVGAAIITFFIFLIPHSLWGTQLDYAKMQRQ